jgi:hypothetical protein
MSVRTVTWVRVRRLITFLSFFEVIIWLTVWTTTSFSSLPFQTLLLLLLLSLLLLTSLLSRLQLTNSIHEIEHFQSFLLFPVFPPRLFQNEAYLWPSIDRLLWVSPLSFMVTSTNPTFFFQESLEDILLTGSLFLFLLVRFDRSRCRRTLWIIVLSMTSWSLSVYLPSCRFTWISLCLLLLIITLLLLTCLLLFSLFILMSEV